MAEKDLETSEGPSLELPSFGLGSLRRRRRGDVSAEPVDDVAATEDQPAAEEYAAEAAPGEASTEPEPASVVAEVEESAGDEAVASASAAENAAEPVVDEVEPSAEEADEVAAEDADVAGDAADDVATEPATEPLDVPAADAEPDLHEEAATEDAGAEDEPHVAATEEAPGEHTDETVETTDDEPVDEATVETTVETTDDEPTVTVFEADDEVGQDAADADAEQTDVRREPQLALPQVSRPWAAAITGVVIGFLLVGLVNLALHACDWLNGTKSCGGPGLFLLLAILVVLMTLGTRILRAWGREDAGTVAFLGVGLAAVIALVLLADQLLSPWMVGVIPAVTVVSFLLAHWVSDTIVGDEV